MKDKKYIILFIILFVVILVAGVFEIKKLRENKQTASIEDEYTPEEEVTEEQLDSNNTVATVYFPNKETNKLMPEAKVVDVRDIVNSPYQKLVELLIEGPSSDKLEKIIPDGTLLLDNQRDGDTVTLSFSNNLLNYGDEANKDLLINSIVNTLTELTEVNKVKILIDGNENEAFKEFYQRE